MCRRQFDSRRLLVPASEDWRQAVLRGVGWRLRIALKRMKHQVRHRYLPVINEHRRHLFRSLKIATVAAKVFVLKLSRIDLGPVDVLLSRSSRRLFRSIGTIPLFCSAPGMVEAQLCIASCVWLRYSCGLLSTLVVSESNGDDVRTDGTRLFTSSSCVSPNGTPLGPRHAKRSPRKIVLPASAGAGTVSGKLDGARALYCFTRCHE